MQPNNNDPLPNPDEQETAQPIIPEPASEPSVVAQPEIMSPEPTPAVHTPIVINPISSSATPVLNESITPEVIAPMVEQNIITPQNTANGIESPVDSQPTMASEPTTTFSTPQESLPPSSIPQPTPQIIMSPQSVMHDEASLNVPTTAGNPDDLFGKKAKKKKLFLFSGLAVLLLLVISSGLVFGLYLPNTPENVWKTGLSRTGDEVEAIAKKVSDPESFSALSKNKVTIAGQLNFADQNATINFDSNFDETKSDNNLDVGISSGTLAEPINLNAKVKTSLPEGSLWPNVFFNISGLESLGLDSFYPGLSSYGGKWISIEQDFYEKYLSEAIAGDDASNITEQDVISVMNDAVEVSQEYLFSSDPEKAVLNNDKFIGSEESEGITAYRYQASINEANAEKFCIALIDKLYANESFKKINNTESSELEKTIEDAKKSCSSGESTDESSEEEPEIFDIWIDKKYKIMHKIRFTEDLEAKSQKMREQKAECLENSSQYDFEGSMSSFCDYYDELIETGEKYVELGQIYKGEDEFVVFVNQINNTNVTKNSIRGDISINANDLSINGKITYKDESEDSKGSAEISIKTEPFAGEIDAGKPEGSIPLQQVIDDLTNQSMQSSQELGANTEDSDGLNDDSNQSYYQRLLNFLELFN